MDEDVRTRFHKLSGSVNQTAKELAVLIESFNEYKETQRDRALELKDKFAEHNDKIKNADTRISRVYATLVGLLVSVITLLATLYLQKAGQ